MVPQKYEPSVSKQQVLSLVGVAAALRVSRLTFLSLKHLLFQKFWSQVLFICESWVEDK